MARIHALSVEMSVVPLLSRTKKGTTPAPFDAALSSACSALSLAFSSDEPLSTIVQVARFSWVAYLMTVPSAPASSANASPSAAISAETIASLTGMAPTMMSFAAMS